MVMNSPYLGRRRNQVKPIVVPVLDIMTMTVSESILEPESDDMPVVEKMVNSRVKKFKCNKCPESFDDRSAWMKHLHTHRRKGGSI